MNVSCEHSDNAKARTIRDIARWRRCAATAAEMDAVDAGEGDAGEVAGVVTELKGITSAIADCTQAARVRATASSMGLRTSRASTSGESSEGKVDVRDNGECR